MAYKGKLKDLLVKNPGDTDYHQKNSRRIVPISPELVMKFASGWLYNGSLKILPMESIC